MTRNLPREAAILLALTLIAGGVRMTRLEAPSLWADELSTVRDALSPNLFISKQFGYLPTKIGLTLFGLGPETLESREFHNWRQRGLNEFKARLPSCLIGILTIPLIYIAARGLVSPLPAAIATLLLAFAHWHVLWSQSARFYSLQFLFYTTALLTYWNAMEKSSIARLILAGILASLAFLSQPTAGVLFIILGLDWIIRWRRGALPSFAKPLTCIALVLILGLAAVVGSDIAKDPSKWSAFLQKPNQEPFRIILATIFYILPPIVVAGAIATYSLWRRCQPIGVFLFSAGTLPAMVFAVVGLFGFVEVRYCLVSLFPWLLLAGIACTSCFEAFRSAEPAEGSKAKSQERLALASLPVLMLLTVEIVALFGYFTEGGYRSRVREAIQYVAKNIQPGDLFCAEAQEGGYYMGREVDINIFDLTDAHSTLSHRTWIVSGAGNHGNPPGRWLREKTRLMACFETHLVGPSESVQVHLYTPNGNKVGM